jgi:hypothetical protein
MPHRFKVEGVAMSEDRPAVQITAFQFTLRIVTVAVSLAVAGVILHHALGTGNDAEHERRMRAARSDASAPISQQAEDAEREAYKARDRSEDRRRQVEAEVKKSEEGDSAAPKQSE